MQTGLCGPQCAIVSPVSHRVPCPATGPGAEEEEGLLLLPEPLPGQELGKDSGCPLWGCCRTRTPLSPCCHCCRDLSRATRVSRSSEQLEPSSPCTVPRPSWGHPELVTAPRWHHTHPAISTCPQQPQCQRQGCGDEGAAFPSLPVPVPIPSPCPAGRGAPRLSQIPAATGRWLLLLLPVLPPPLRTQPVPECERKLLRR